MKIAVHLASIRQPLKQALLTAARMDAQGVEIDGRNMVKPQEMTRTAVRHLRKMLEDLNLRVCAISFRTRRGYDEADDLERRIDATKQAMQMAYQLGATVVINHIGRVPAEFKGPAWDTLKQALEDLGRFGQHAGALLAAETGTEDGSRLAALIAQLTPGSLVVNLDPSNLIVNGFSPREAIAALGEHVHHVHATDAVYDLARGRGEHTPLGRGSADIPELIGLLEEQHYRGYFTVKREDSQDPVMELGNAVKYLKNL
jgi:sugar phosphate isomerase/epimerase